MTNAQATIERAEELKAKKDKAERKQTERRTGLKLCKHGVNRPYCRICTPASKLKAAKEAKIEAQRAKRAGKAPKQYQGKHAAIISRGETVINEAVGIHWRVAKDFRAPVEGDLVMVRVGKHEIPLVVRHTQKCVNGETLCQAFTGLRQNDGETPAYKVLGEKKGEKCTIEW